MPRSSDDLVRMGRFFSATTFLNAGNITHTPAYGHMISLGIQHAVTLRNASDVQVRNAEAFRAYIGETEKFVTFAAGHATIGYRMRSDPADAKLPADRPGDGRRAGDQRQDRHAHKPGLR